MAQETRGDRRIRTALSDEELQCRRIAIKLLTGRMQVQLVKPSSALTVTATDRHDTVAHLLRHDFVGDAAVVFGPTYTALGDHAPDSLDDDGFRVRAPKPNFGGLDEAGLSAALHLFEEYFGLPDLRDHDVAERAEAVALKLMTLAR